MALDEPTLHLTFGINNRTGIDLLAWFTDQMRDLEIFRRDLPRFASPEEIITHGKSLWQEVARIWDEKIIERFFSEQDATAPARVSTGLPWAATAQIIPKDAGVHFQSVLPRMPGLRITKDTVEFAALGKRFSFSSQAGSVLRRVLSGDPFTMAQLAEFRNDELTEATLWRFLEELAKQGIIAPKI